MKQEKGLEQQQEEKIWIMAWISFCWSCSSLMVFSVLPVYLSRDLHVNHKGVGLMEGIAIGLSFSSKFFAGYISDKLKKRKPLIIAGSLITVLTKPMFALASGSTFVFFTRFLDRFFKGIRSSPSDAWIADSNSGSSYRKFFGIRQAIYTLGGVVGAALSMVIMKIAGENFKLIFYLATIPGIIALYLLLKHFKDFKIEDSRKSVKWDLNQLGQFSSAYWVVILVSLFLMLARFSEAFLSLKGMDIEISVISLPLLIILMDLTHSFFAYFSGRWTYKYSLNQIMIIGFLILIAADFFLGMANSLPLFLVGIFVNGMHLGLTQGVLRTLVAVHAPEHLRGTAFAIFSLTCGVGVLVGNIIAGSVADQFGIDSCFLFGAISTVFATAIMIFFRPQLPAKKLFYSHPI